VQKDFRNEKLGFKIREAQLQKTPYMLVIGDKEVETGTITPRFRDGQNLPSMSTAAFADFIVQEVANFR
jgi:threonyl-tRNA synthetase